MTIRKLETEDAVTASLIEQKSFTDPWSGEAIRESILRSCDGDKTVFAVGAFEDELVGYAFLYVAAGEGELVNIAVSEKMRGQGIGVRLIESLAALPGKAGVMLDFIYLEVRKSNISAIRLYEKIGFEALGIRRDFYSNPKEDAIIMKWHLEDKC